MRWELDPDFALQSRLSFGRGARYGWVLTAVAVFLAFDGFATNLRLSEGFVRAGLFLLLGALPYGAVQVRALERRGHLDARRLTGGSPFALGLMLIGGSAWVLLFSGVVLLLLGTATGDRLPAFTLAALIALAVAMALILLLMPPSIQVDSWMLLTLLAAGVYSTVESMRFDRGVALGVMIVSALILPWALPLALRRMRGAAARPAGPPTSVMRLIVRMSRAARPEFARGLVAAGQSFSIAPLMAAAGVWSIWWLTRNLSPTARDIFEVIAVYAPLILAGYDTAARVRHEHEIGGLDRIHLSGQEPWRVVLEVAGAFSAPFVAVSLASAAAVATLDASNAAGIISGWPVVASVLILGPLTGAFRGRKPGLFVAAALPVAGLLSDAPWDLGLLTVATTFGLAVTSFARPVRLQPVSWTAAAAVAGLAGVVAGVVDSSFGPLMVAGLMSLGAVFLGPGRRMTDRSLVLCAAAAAIAAGLAEFLWGNGRFALEVRIMQSKLGPLVMAGDGSRIAYAGLVSLAAPVGLVLGRYGLERPGERRRAAFALQVAPIAAALCDVVAKLTPVFVSSNAAFQLRTGYDGVAIAQLLVLGALAGVAAVLVWREIRETRPRP